MKKTTRVWFHLSLLCFIALIISHPARAQGFKSIHVFAGGSYTSLKTEKTDQGFGFDGGAIVGLTPQFGILGIFNYASIGSKGRPLGEGTLNLTSISAGLAYRILRGSWSPFATAGVIFQFSSFDLENASAFEPTGFQPEQSVENSTGFYLGGGLHVNLSNQLGLIGWVRYSILDIDVKVTVVDEVSGLTVENTVSGIDLNPLWFGVNLVYRF